MLPYGANPRSLANSATRQDYHRQSVKINAHPGISDAVFRLYRWCKRVVRVAIRNRPPQTALRLRSRCATSANGLPVSLPNRFYEGKGASEQKRFVRARIAPKRGAPESSG